jgi:hypothetical protein
MPRDEKTSIEAFRRWATYSFAEQSSFVSMKVGFIANKNLFFRETRKFKNSYVVKSGLFEQPLKEYCNWFAVGGTVHVRISWLGGHSR